MPPPSLSPHTTEPRPGRAVSPVCPRVVWPELPGPLSDQAPPPETGQSFRADGATTTEAWDMPATRTAHDLLPRLFREQRCKLSQGRKLPVHRHRRPRPFQGSLPRGTREIFTVSPRTYIYEKMYF